MKSRQKEWGIVVRNDFLPPDHERRFREEHESRFPATTTTVEAEEDDVRDQEEEIEEKERLVNGSR